MKALRGRRCRDCRRLGEAAIGRRRRGCRSTDQRAVATRRRHADASRPTARSSPPGNGQRRSYTVTAETELTGITAIRLEVIADERLPSGGPGLAPDGNFVLNEFEVTAAPKADPKQVKKVAFQNAASRLQPGKAFRSPRPSTATPTPTRAGPSRRRPACTHWADLRDARSPSASTGGTVLTFKLHHKFQTQRISLGRFRLSVTQLAKPPFEPGAARGATGRSSRPSPRCATDAQQETAARPTSAAIDPELPQRDQTRCNASSSRLPIDPEAEGAARTAGRRSASPVPPDRRLVQLRDDMEMSIQQWPSAVSPAAQDVAWALINSPAFLFNH